MKKVPVPKKEVGGDANAAALIGVKELAVMLGEGDNERAVYKMREAGRLPPTMRHTRNLRWRKAEVRDWIDAGCPPYLEWMKLQNSR